MGIPESAELLKREHAHLDAVIKEEESHLWKNIQKIEELKKAKLRKKDQLLRISLLNFKN
ncbi:MAG: DUF465 domain-containing protein [Lactobacillus sp.]|jgi:uncharacterized protein YdcH (DUF465 family)|nr:DUF465 domain-containing protein [Lactobacillus sp.]